MLDLNTCAGGARVCGSGNHGSSTGHAACHYMRVLVVDSLKEAEVRLTHGLQ